MPKQSAPTTSSQENNEEWEYLGDYLQLSGPVVRRIINDQTSSLPTELRALAELAIRGKVGKSHHDATAAFAKIVSYDGFNPQTIIHELVTKAAKANEKRLDGEYVFEMDGLRYVVPQAASIAKDCHMLITLFLVRGNNLFKILKTISKEAKVAISAKMTQYGIKSDDDADAAARKRKERVVLASKDITLSRIAASFPHITLSIAKHANILGKANLIVIKEQYKINGGRQTDMIPTVLQHGLIPALIPREEQPKYEPLRHFCYMFNLEQSMTLQHPSVKKNMVMEPLQNHIDNSIKYVSAAINGPLTDDASRADLLDSILDVNDSDVEKWLAAGRDAWRRCQNSFNYANLVSSITSEAAALGSQSGYSIERES